MVRVRSICSPSHEMVNGFTMMSYPGNTHEGSTAALEREMSRSNSVEMISMQETSSTLFDVAFCSERFIEMQVGLHETQDPEMQLFEQAEIDPSGQLRVFVPQSTPKQRS